MNICICTATEIEVQRNVLDDLKNTSGHSVELLISGIGIASTTFQLSRLLSTRKIDLLINAGICGSFSDKFKIGDVVQIVEDVFADLGVDDNGTFIPFPSKFLKTDRLVNKSVPFNNVPSVKGITVNTVTGSVQKAEQWIRLFNADVETNESAAVFYTCMQTNTPFICLRSVSNRVGPRNKDMWNIPFAIDNLWKTIFECVLNMKSDE